jgi:hypothetical protein
MLLAADAALAVNANLSAVPLFMGVAGILYGLNRLRSTNRLLLEDKNSRLLSVVGCEHKCAWEGHGME